MASSDFGEGDGGTREREAPARPRLRRFPYLPPGAFDRFAAWRGDLRLWLGAAFEREMEARRGFLWLPVCFGIGILVYFALPQEPSALAVSGLAVALRWRCDRWR